MIITSLYEAEDIWYISNMEKMRNTTFTYLAVSDRCQYYEGFYTQLTSI